MEVYATGIAGLTMVQQDYETTYTKEGGGEFVVNGEYDSGEAWINGAWYYYERDEAAGVVKLGNEDNEVCFVFEDTEEGWEKFANSVT